MNSRPLAAHAEHPIEPVFRTPGARSASPAARPYATPAARLYIAAEDTRLVGGATGEHGLEIAPGADRLLREHFAQRLPQPVAIENAIMDIEDALAQVPASVRGGAIASDDPALRRLALAAGLPADASTLHRDAIEQLFSRQAAVAEGRPASAEGLPDDPRFVAELLVVRELMHHLDIPRIQLDDGDRPGRDDRANTPQPEKTPCKAS
ncbi:MAG: hypothetical protein KDH20_22460 [Rhodocyclaceae bacterium]|nr:hypothetical protein [Rhodocyclaceae bacterium]